jgi:hypothetical protein
VVTEVIPGARSVALGVMVAAGSRFESPGQQGASHLLEHLLFRGSAGRDGRAIAVADGESDGFGPTAAGAIAEAVNLYREVTQGRSLQLGENHPTTLESEHNLGCALLDQKLDLAAAERHLSHVLTERRKIFSDKDQLVLATLNAYANCRSAQARTLLKDARDQIQKGITGN